MFSTQVNCSSLEKLHPFRKENFTDFPINTPLIPNTYHQLHEPEPGLFQWRTTKGPICESVPSGTPISIVIDQLIANGGVFHICQRALTIPPNVTMIIESSNGQVTTLASTKAHPLLYLWQEKITKMDLLPITVAKIKQVFLGLEKYFILKEL